MTTIPFTTEQQQAIDAAGCSVIVSAAAGSGKTAVLAQRCAYLVCDAPPQHRCDIDHLLVLTFTDAAATEMRSRIVAALRERLGKTPNDRRLREQISLAGAAHISTIHAFCQWLIRRWFSELGLDPAATLLDGDEANLLRREVLHDLFSSLYERANSSPSNSDKNAISDTFDEVAAADKLSLGFIDLVDVYGLGQDAPIGSLILGLSNFLSSLPNPEAWLTEAESVQIQAPEKIVLRLAEALDGEMQRQAEHALQLATRIEEGDEIGLPYADAIRAYAKQLQDWSTQLSSCIAESPASLETRLERVDILRGDIDAYELLKVSIRLAKDADPELRQARDNASKLYSSVKKDLFAKRIQSRYCLFSVAEWMDGLAQTGPHVSTITGMTRAFLEAYAARKKQDALLDFSDLERFAFELLVREGDVENPSDIAIELQKRFAHVLVDEFQDINPIQQTILKLISRESNADLNDNLFTVGDVKQSIYRFRLAEPALFTQRLQNFRDATDQRQAIDLQKNFRSRAEVIDAVNLIFRSLMPARVNSIVYDDRAALRLGREVPQTTRQPAEIHLLQRKFSQEDSQEESPVIDYRSSQYWSYAAREAYVIGSRIQSLIEAGTIQPDGEALTYKHIAILLRAARVNGQQMASMLTTMGIPAYAAAGGSLMDVVEVRDVLAALRVLDNFQQDIPLAAVMRSGIFGEKFNADDLLSLRNLNRSIPFHACVRAYGENGTDMALQLRVASLLARMEKFRRAMRQRATADVLWELFEQFGFLAYVGGRPNGRQRRANLLKLHRLTQEFGGFRRQGLHRFIRYVDSLTEAEREVSIASTSGESENVVQIMTIHQSKGLEFPVVFLAGLGTKFNLGDRQGRMIYDRVAKLGLNAIDREKMIEYPSAAHRLVVDEIERNARDEEARILYVAMTRARDKLVLVGSTNEVEAWSSLTSRTAQSPPPSQHALTTASTPLDWLYPTLAAAPLDAVAANDKNPGTLFTLRTYLTQEMLTWQAQTQPTDDESATLQAVANLEPVSTGETIASEDAKTEDLLQRFDRQYPFLAATSIRAAIGASEVKRYFDDTRDPLDEPGEAIGSPSDNKKKVSFVIPTAHANADDTIDAPAQRGIINHRVLQHLDFEQTRDEAGVREEILRLSQSQLLSQEEASLVEVEAIAWFLTTPIAEKIRRIGQAFRREFHFICTEPLDWFDATQEVQSGDTVLVRGIVDGVLPEDQTVEIIDYKTDRVSSDDVATRALNYRPQMMLYARAIEQLWKKPVSQCSLVFLTPRKIEVLTDL